MPPMNRRDAIRATGLGLGALLLATNGVLAACGREPRGATTGILPAADQDLAEEMADTLLPTTPSSPGAKAAGVGAAINLLLTDCYPEQQQVLLAQGLHKFGEGRGKGFAEMPRAQREAILRDLDSKTKVNPPGGDWYAIFHELALRAYFTSEVGMTKALRFTMVPGRWQGCVPLQPGQPAWG